MPAISGPDLARLRRQRQSTKLHLAVYHPAPMFTAQVDGLQTAGAVPVHIKNPTVISTPIPNAQVVFSTTSGGVTTIVGIARYRWNASGLSLVTRLWLGPHNAPLADNTDIAILTEIKAESILPRILPANVQYEDTDVVYVAGDNENYPPLSLMGPPAVARIDPATGLATISFYSSSVSIGASTLTDWLWTFPGGLAGSSALPGAPPPGAPVTESWSATGEYYVSLWVKDNHNKTAIGYRPVWIFDPENRGGLQPYRVVISSDPEVDVDSGGWSTELTVHGAADESVFPDNAMVCLFADDRFGTEQISVGGDYVYRENIVMVGYIRSGTQMRDWSHGSVTFQVDGVGKILDTCFARAANFKDASTPTSWHQHKGMTCDKVAYHLLSRRSTISEIADCDLNTPAKQMKRIDLTQASLFDQLNNQIYGAVRSRIGSSASGRIYARVNPQLVALADRTQPVILAAAFTDLRGPIGFADELHLKPSARIDFMGFNYNGTDQNPIHSLAPPYPWTHGTLESVTGVRADSQSEANEFAGYFEGWKNNEWANVELHWRGNYRIFEPILGESVTLTIAASENKRGITWSAVKFYPKRVSFHYSNRHLEVDTLVERDIVGAQGVIGPYPPSPPAPPAPPPPPEPPPPPPPPIPPPYPDGPDEGDWRSKVYVFTMARGVYYSADFTGPGGAMPTWTEINTGLPVTTLKDGRPDPWAPSARQYCLTAQDLSPNGYNEVYRRTGGAWSRVLAPSDLAALFSFPVAGIDINALETDINIQGFVAVLFIGGSGGTAGVHYAFSLDYGATWQKYSTTPIYATMNNRVSKLFVGAFKGGSAKAAGQLLYAPIFTIGGGTPALCKSVNGGQNWSTVRTDIDWESVCFAPDPYQDVVYAWRDSTTGFFATKGLYRSTDQGANFSLLLNDYLLFNTFQNGFYRCSFIYPGDATKAQMIRACISTNVSTDPPTRMSKSIDAGASWPVTNNFPAITANGGDPVGAIAGLSAVHDAYDKLYFVGSGGNVGGVDLHHVYVSEDDGVTMHGKAGADRSAGTVNGIPNNAGRTVHIIQCWDL